MLQIIESKSKILSHTREELQENVRYACRLKLPEVNTRDKSKKDTWVICAGGPSLKESIQEIKEHQVKGHRIVSVGATYDLLVNYGIIPDYYILLDASSAIATFFTPLKDTQYLVASQCNKVVFDKLKGYNVKLWHPADTYDNEPIIRSFSIKSPLVPGGSTTALRAFELGYRMGVNKFHYYGVDSSADEFLYAYELRPGNRDNEEDKILHKVFMVCSNGYAREFLTTVDLGCQASEFMVLCRKYTEAVIKGKVPCKIEVHGKGLVPCSWNTYFKMRHKDPSFDLGIAIQEGSWDRYKADDED